MAPIEVLGNSNYKENDNFQIELIPQKNSLSNLSIEDVDDDETELNDLPMNKLKVKLSRTETQIRTTHYFEIIG